jgi:hypothetical protein
MVKGEDIEVKFNCCNICEEMWGVQLDHRHLGKNTGWGFLRILLLRGIFDRKEQKCIQGFGGET